MKSSKKPSTGIQGRSTRRGSLRGRALPSMERLEGRLLLANSITIANGGLGSIPVGASDFSDTGNYTIAPSALVNAINPVAFRANAAITFSDPVAGMQV